MSRSRGRKSAPFGEPQLDLFEARDEEASVAEVVELESLRERLPAKLRLGTSSWTFPGWAGLVYHRHYSDQRTFVRESLSEYARHPLMRTVGIDRGYYSPVSEEDLAAYARQLPDDFRAAIKIWQRITIPIFPRHPRYGDEAGRANPDFLDADLFRDAVYEPVRRSFARHMGPWILEIAPSPTPLDPAWLDQKLSAFLSRAPGDFPFAVELRDRRLLTDAYARTLQTHGASHVFNFWSRMPSLAEQMRLESLLRGSLMVIRLLLPPGARYEELRDAYAPFDRLVRPQPAMRHDVIRLVRGALDRGVDVYVLVNNKAEGSSPLTVRALAEELAR